MAKSNTVALLMCYFIFIIHMPNSTELATYFLADEACKLNQHAVRFQCDADRVARHVAEHDHRRVRSSGDPEQ